MPRLEAPAMQHAILRLEPLRADHAAGLREAATGAADGTRYALVPAPETVDKYLADDLRRAAGGEYAPFAQIDAASGAVIGHTSYLAPRWWPGEDRLLAVEIGSTWLAPRARGTALNSAAKLLLLTHAFESLGVERVDIKTDARNAPSRAGILAIGATFEGILRSWQPSAAADEAGRPRDTAMHSIVRAEWPGVRARLETRIAAKLAA